MTMRGRGVRRRAALTGAVGSALAAYLVVAMAVPAGAQTTPPAGTPPAPAGGAPPAAAPAAPVPTFEEFCPKNVEQATTGTTLPKSTPSRAPVPTDTAPQLDVVLSRD